MQRRLRTGAAWQWNARQQCRHSADVRASVHAAPNVGGAFAPVASCQKSGWRRAPPDSAEKVGPAGVFQKARTSAPVVRLRLTAPVGIGKCD